MYFRSGGKPGSIFSKESIKMRVMAIDYGDARTGVAISDPAGLLAG